MEKFGAGLIIAIVVGVVMVIVVGTVLMAGVVFLWAQSFEGEETTFDMLNLRFEADDETDEITAEVLTGTVFWGDYEITANDMAITTTSFSSSAGQIAVFTGLDMEQGQLINIKVIKIGEGRVRYSDSIQAK